MASSLLVMLLLFGFLLALEATAFPMHEDQVESDEELSECLHLRRKNGPVRPRHLQYGVRMGWMRNGP